MSSKNLTLKAKVREDFGNNASRRSRRAGSIPAVIYAKDKASKHVLVDTLEWRTLESHDVHVIDLDVEGETLSALVKEVQHNYLKGETLHIDFQEIDMSSTITASVTVHGNGTPVGLGQGGILEQAMHELEISCMASKLPEALEIDISGIE